MGVLCSAWPSRCRRLILATIIVLLAGPQQFSAPKTKRVLTNIEFCVDVSSSMITPLGDGTRYDASMKAIDHFLDIRKGDAFGLTFFGNNVLHWVPLTGDPSAIRCAPPVHETGKRSAVDGGDDDRQGTFSLQGDPGRARGGGPDDHPGFRRRKLRS